MKCARARGGQRTGRNCREGRVALGVILGAGGRGGVMCEVSDLFDCASGEEFGKLGEIISRQAGGMSL